MKNIFIEPVIILSLFSFFVSPAKAEIEFREHVIETQFDSPYSVHAADLDGDDDMDILGAAYGDNKITWWENDGDEDFAEHDISDEFGGARSVHAVDLDDDGDMDVLGAAYSEDLFVWWENNGNEVFTQHIISNEYDGPRDIYAADLNDDGYLDILGASYGDDAVTWWENDGNENFAEHQVTTNFLGVQSVFAHDFDGDEDLDIFAAAYLADNIAWWENDGAGNFAGLMIDNNFSSARDIHAEDINGDNYIDVIATASGDNTIAWWENDDEQNLTEHIISENFDGAYSVHAADINTDGDVDIIGTAFADDQVMAWINDGIGGFEEISLTSTFDGGISIYSEDIDSDDDLDVIGAALIDDEITWWENRGTRPHEFSLISPEDETELDNISVGFTWESAFDEDINDSITYTLIITENDGMADPVEIDAGSDTSFVLDTLEDDAEYFWNVKALDQDMHIRWSTETWTFSLNVPEPPGSFSLVTPGDEWELDSLNFLFAWGTAFDPDPSDTVTYQVYLSTDENFTNPRVIEAGEDTSELIDDFQNETGYWWKVFAADNNTEGTWSDETWTFSIIRLFPPSELEAHLDLQIGEVSLVWQHEEEALDELIGFIVYRDNVPLDTTDETTYWDQLEAYGEFNYYVTSLYDSGESEPSNEIDILWAPMVPPYDLSVSLNDSTGQVTLEWEHDRYYYCWYKIYRNDVLLDTSDNQWYVDQLVENGIYSYEVSTEYLDSDETETAGPVEIEWNQDAVTQSIFSGIPTDWGITAIYPNPFNSTLNVIIAMPRSTSLSLQLYNIEGQMVSAIATGNFEVGYHSFHVKSEYLSSGLYFINATYAGKEERIHKIVLIK
ncbi:MAG: FG-GAP-like repeat-containing protein [Candidatus Electryonea clarkiae]|nr:FG-GAP-like repeat-containing protein [Candidatus Electryonea clarkiae]MDP8285522.1 FG-GAP-like repeat-containing protein [Candidatus Electryonea clarkiae]